MRKKHILLLYLICSIFCSSCGFPNQDVITCESNYKGKRDNRAVCLTPDAPGILELGNKHVTIDASNTDKGYICVKYIGANCKVKLQITGPDQITYTYDLKSKEYETFPFTRGNGVYKIGVYENIKDYTYAVVYTQDINVEIKNEFSPFLFPSQYVNFTKDSYAVKVASELAYAADSDLEVVSLIYNYVVNNVSYDEEVASTLPSGYVSDIDGSLKAGKGICIDYAAIMAAMLRSQRIPARVEFGYVQGAYHSWISAYIKDIGWVNGIIEFDGTGWKLMDPTFASTSSRRTLEKLMSNEGNYIAKYVY